MRIRTALAATTLAALAVLGGAGAALADGGHDKGDWEGSYRFENLGGPYGITEGSGTRGDSGHGHNGYGFFDYH
ncbi:hypothetical protein ABZ951_31155 [Streptomyces sp. NPDC046215]